MNLREANEESIYDKIKSATELHIKLSKEKEDISDKIDDNTEYLSKLIEDYLNQEFPQLIGTFEIIFNDNYIEFKCNISKIYPMVYISYKIPSSSITKSINNIISIKDVINTIFINNEIYSKMMVFNDLKKFYVSFNTKTKYFK